MVKRVLDILGAGLGLLVFAPILAVVSVMIVRQMGAPVLFRQTRGGGVVRSEPSLPPMSAHGGQCVFMSRNNALLLLTATFQNVLNACEGSALA